MELIYHLFVSARPRQWIKNFGLFIPLILDGKLLHWDRFLPVSIGVIAFSFLSSSNYIVNDMLDAGSDKLHPYKKNRPLANRDVTYTQASITAIILCILGIALSYSINQQFLLLAVLFVLLHYLSYFFFRRVAVLDVLMLASGYLIRIVAGETAALTPMSVWLFLTVLSGSLLLAIGKRRSEFAIAQNSSEKMQLKIKEGFHYSEKVLDAYVAVFASATFLAYTYFTFLSTLSESGLLFKGYGLFLLTIISRKWMMVTVPFVLYGIMRYLQLVYSGKEVLVKVVTTDKALLFTVGLWVLVVFFVVYGIGG